MDVIVTDDASNDEISTFKLLSSLHGSIAMSHKLHIYSFHINVYKNYLTVKLSGMFYRA